MGAESLLGSDLLAQLVTQGLISEHKRELGGRVHALPWPRTPADASALGWRRESWLCSPETALLDLSQGNGARHIPVGVAPWPQQIREATVDPGQGSLVVEHIHDAQVRRGGGVRNHVQSPVYKARVAYRNRIAVKRLDEVSAWAECFR